MSADYKCIETNEWILDHLKVYGEDYPESITKDDKIFVRWFGGKNRKAPVMDVAEGLHGNAANGYSSLGSTYMASKYTPTNKIPGIAGTMAGAEVD